MLVYSFAQRIAFQIGICLHPSVGLYDLLGKRGRCQDLRDQRIRVERNRRDQALQLLGSLLRVGGRLRALRRRGRVLHGRKLRRPNRAQHRDRQQRNQALPSTL